MFFQFQSYFSALLLHTLFFGSPAVASPYVVDHGNGIIISYANKPALEDRVLEERGPACEINGVLALFKGLAGPATAFCSSFLSIGTSTLTTTVMPVG